MDWYPLSLLLSPSLSSINRKMGGHYCCQLLDSRSRWLLTKRVWFLLSRASPAGGEGGGGTRRRMGVPAGYFYHLNCCCCHGSRLLAWITISWSRRCSSRASYSLGDLQNNPLTVADLSTSICTGQSFRSGQCGRKRAVRDPMNCDSWTWVGTNHLLPKQHPLASRPLSPSRVIDSHTFCRTSTVMALNSFLSVDILNRCPGARCQHSNR